MVSYLMLWTLDTRDNIPFPFLMWERLTFSGAESGKNTGV